MNKWVQRLENHTNILNEVITMHLGTLTDQEAADQIAYILMVSPWRVTSVSPGRIELRQPLKDSICIFEKED